LPETYQRLARHLGPLLSGYPFDDNLIELIKGGFSEPEAQAALAIPNDLVPLEVAPFKYIAARSEMPAQELGQLLDGLAARGQIFSRPAPDGGPGYALLQVGYGMPQSYFWGGQSDATAQKMAKLVLGYFKVNTTREIYGGRSTKTFRYAPASLSVDLPKQGVLPQEMMEPVISVAEKIALCHCPCRTSARVLGRTDCEHSLEVCLKYDEMAEFVLDRGLGRQISADEALAVLKKSEEEGLVHMVDNAEGAIKHTCNCCGHYCWNVGIIRRRKIPRDVLMASYFIRATEAEECIGCGACVDICPVDAIRLEDDVAVVDQDWCIGCGVCAVPCPTDAISIVRRIEGRSPGTTGELFERMKNESSTT
jgi:Pyruvate/2-oxoacid:ferredoxin oxidoreductase delta subunit